MQAASISELNATIAHLLEKAPDTASRARYSSALSHWIQFLELLGNSGASIPPLLLEQYVAYRFRHSGICGATISVELAAIRELAIRNGTEYPSEHRLRRLRRLTRGFQRLRCKSTKKHALPLSTAKHAIIGKLQEGNLDSLMEAAALATGFCGMFRVSEMTAASLKHKSALSYADIVFTPSLAHPTSARIGFSKSKMNQFQAAEEVVLVCGCQHGVCALHTMAAYMRHRSQKHSHQPLFAYDDGSPLTASKMRKLVKSAARHAGLDPADYSAHSLRSGGATALFERGVDLAIVEQLGRWCANSKTLKRCYLQVTTLRAAMIAFREPK